MPETDPKPTSREPRLDWLMREGRRIIEIVPKESRGTLAGLLFCVVTLILLAYTLPAESFQPLIWVLGPAIAIVVVALGLFPFFKLVLRAFGFDIDNGDSVWKRDRVKFVMKLKRLETGKIGPAKQLGYLSSAIQMTHADVLYVLTRLGK